MNSEKTKRILKNNDLMYYNIKYVQFRYKEEFFIGKYKTTYAKPSIHSKLSKSDHTVNPITLQLSSCIARNVAFK